MKPQRRFPAVVTIALVSVLALAGCSDSDADSDKAESGQAATATPAAELRAGLTDLLTQHVYMAGIALKTAVDEGGNLEAPSVKAAVAALDSNSVALSKAVGSAYPEAQKPFLDS